MSGPPDTPARLALVGLGKQARDHLTGAAASSRVRIIAGYDLSAASREAAEAHAPGLTTYESLEAMLDADRPDGLVLALPHHEYAPLWDALVAPGLPLLKEKPLGRNVSEAFDFLARARARGVHVRTAIQRREHPSYQRLKTLLADTEVESIAMTWHMGLPAAAQSSGWRGDARQAGGGVLLDGGYHLVDLAHYLVGPIELVAAQLWRDGRLATPECVENEAALVARRRRTWLRLECHRGGEKKDVVVADTAAGRFEATREGVWLDGDLIENCEREWNGAMTRQIEAFADDIRDRRFDDPVVWDQLPAMRVIDQAYAMARLRQPLGATPIPTEEAR